MASTEETAEPTVRQRKTNHTQEEAFKQHNGDVSDNIIGLIKWKRHIEEVKAELLEDMNCHLKIVLDKAITQAVEPYTKKDETVSSGLKKRPRGSLSDRKKVFLPQASMLDELMEVEHFRTIYHMFLAALLVFVISTVAVDIIDQGRLVLEFDLLFYAFGQFETVVWSWICLFIYSLLVPYKVLSFWSSWYPKSKHKLLLSTCLGIFLLVSQTCVLCIFPIYVVNHYRLPPASSFIIILEKVRFLMKTYSFYRETIPVLLLDDSHTDHPSRLHIMSSLEKNGKMPSLSSYLYFLFCPTLVYRDSYPRTPYIRWKYVAKNFAQFLGGIFFLYFIMVTLCIPVFKNMSKQPFSTKTLVLSIFHATLPGTFLLLVSFFAFLHCWMNAFAEMLRFADRMFYKDWWNSKSFSNYYRTWNLIIHDWLYYYVYQDLLWLLKKRFRTGVMLLVFLISATVHEYALIMCLGFFYPVMFCLFAFFGVIFNFMMNDKWTSPIWNVLIWAFLFIGQGIQLCLYCQEWYAQIHCPLTEKTFWGLVTPRSWSCYL